MVWFSHPRPFWFTPLLILEKSDLPIQHCALFYLHCFWQVQGFGDLYGRENKTRHNWIIFNLYQLMKHRSRTEHWECNSVEVETPDILWLPENSSYHGIMAGVFWHFQRKPNFICSPWKLDADVIKRINAVSHFFLTN